MVGWPAGGQDLALEEGKLAWANIPLACRRDLWQEGSVVRKGRAELCRGPGVCSPRVYKCPAAAEPYRQEYQAYTAAERQCHRSV